MSNLRYVRFLTALALGSMAGCGADAISEDQVPLRKLPDPGAFAGITGKDLATARATIWNPGVHGRSGKGKVTGPDMVFAGSPRSATGVNAASAVTTLVLYDSTGQWGFLGELYAIGTANLASHFGSWTAKAPTVIAPYAIR